MPLTATREPQAWPALSHGEHVGQVSSTYRPAQMSAHVVCVCGESSGLGPGSSFYSLLSPLILSTS